VPFRQGGTGGIQGKRYKLERESGGDRSARGEDFQRAKIKENGRKNFLNRPNIKERTKNERINDQGRSRPHKRKNARHQTKKKKRTPPPRSKKVEEDKERTSEKTRGENVKRAAIHWKKTSRSRTRVPERETFEPRTFVGHPILKSKGNGRGSG